MGPEQLTALRRQEPFRPFRICLADGRQLTVAHPELVLVGLDDVTIGFARKNSEKPYLFEHKTTVDLSDIVAFDFVDLKSAEASSQRE